MFFGHIAIYLVTTRAIDRTGKWAFWVLMPFILLVAAVATMPQLSVLTTLSVALLWPIGNWVDRHREMKAAAVPQAA